MQSLVSVLMYLSMQYASLKTHLPQYLNPLVVMPFVVYILYSTTQIEV